MDQMSLEEVHEAPERLELFLKHGKAVRITKAGEPLFDAVPIAKSGRFEAFLHNVEEVWAESEVSKTTDEVLFALRESRE
jgi:antitoxin (DNA-binding transcriptional repressor) of toxin-antitoxin stability system